jgi:hypothetical protein
VAAQQPHTPPRASSSRGTVSVLLDHRRDSPHWQANLTNVRESEELHSGTRGCGRKKGRGRPPKAASGYVERTETEETAMLRARLDSELLENTRLNQLLVTVRADSDRERTRHSELIATERTDSGRLLAQQAHAAALAAQNYMAEVTDTHDEEIAVFRERTGILSSLQEEHANLQRDYDRNKDVTRFNARYDARLLEACNISRISASQAADASKEKAAAYAAELAALRVELAASRVELASRQRRLAIEGLALGNKDKELAKLEAAVLAESGRAEQSRKELAEAKIASFAKQQDADFAERRALDSEQQHKVAFAEGVALKRRNEVLAAGLNAALSKQREPSRTSLPRQGASFVRENMLALKEGVFGEGRRRRLQAVNVFPEENGARKPAAAYTADGRRAELTRLGHRIYGSSSKAKVTNEFLESLDVEAFYYKIRGELQLSPLWEWTRRSMATITGKFPEDQVVQLELERGLFRLCDAWRFSQYHLTTLMATKGVSQNVRHLLNALSLVTSRFAGDLKQRRAVMTILRRVRENLRRNRRLLKLCMDNYQQGLGGISSSFGNAHRNRFQAGTDALAFPAGNQPVGDPFILPPGEFAYSLDVDPEIMSSLLKPTFLGLADLTFLESLALKLKFEPKYELKSPPAGCSSVVRWHRTQDSVLNAMKRHKEDFYEIHPGIRRDANESFGIKCAGPGLQPLGFTSNKTSSFSDVVQYMLYLILILRDADVDDDVRDAASSGLASMLRRARFLQSDNQVVPHVVNAISLARLLDCHIFDTLMPICEPWHAVKCLLQKIIIGVGHKNDSADVCIARKLIFEYLFRERRGLGADDEVPWGKISLQLKFDDCYRHCKVVFEAWLMVRPKIMKMKKEDPAFAAANDVNMLLSLFDNSIFVGLYFLPALKMDPELSLNFLRQLIVVCDQWHATGYVKDLARLLYDLENMSPERRAAILENTTFLVGVCIEYMHGVLGATKVEHMERTEETINGQLSNFDNIRQAQETLDLIIGSEKPVNQTYSMPDTHDMSVLKTKLEKHILKLFEAARANRSKVSKDGKKVTTTSFLNGTKLSYSSKLLLKNVAKKCDDIIAGVRVSLERQNNFSGKLPNSKLIWTYETEDPADKGKTLSQTKACDITEKLTQLNKGLSEGQQYKTDGGDRVLRDLIAPHMRREVLQNLQEEDDPDIFKAATMIRRAEKNDFDFIGDVGVFAKPSKKETSRLGKAYDPNILQDWVKYEPPLAPSVAERTTVHDTTENQDDSDDSNTGDSPPEDRHPSRIDSNSEIIRMALALADADAEENVSDDSDANHSENEKMDGDSDVTDDDDDDDDDDYVAANT